MKWNYKYIIKKRFIIIYLSTYCPSFSLLQFSTPKNLLVFSQIITNSKKHWIKQHIFSETDTFSCKTPIIICFIYNLDAAVRHFGNWLCVCVCQRDLVNYLELTCWTALIMRYTVSHCWEKSTNTLWTACIKIEIWKRLSNPFTRSYRMWANVFKASVVGERRHQSFHVASGLADGGGLSRFTGLYL